MKYEPSVLLHAIETGLQDKAVGSETNCGHSHRKQKSDEEFMEKINVVIS